MQCPTIMSFCKQVSCDNKSCPLNDCFLDPEYVSSIYLDNLDEIRF